MTDKQSLPLAGVRVIEFTHMVMGPAAGLMLLTGLGGIVALRHRRRKAA